MIEVVQTAPGKFVTASGHSIKASPSAGGVKTIIRAAGTSQVMMMVNKITVSLSALNLLKLLF